MRFWPGIEGQPNNFNESETWSTTSGECANNVPHTANMFARHFIFVHLSVIYAHFLKTCVSSPETHIFKSVHMMIKLGPHHGGSAGRVPRHSETCFGKVGKSAYTGSFGHFSLDTQKKNFLEKKFFLFQLPPPFFKFCSTYRLLFSWPNFFPKTKMCDFGPESKVDQTTPTHLKLHLQHVGSVQTMSDSSQTCLEEISKSTFLGSFRDIFQKHAFPAQKRTFSKVFTWW